MKFVLFTFFPHSHRQVPGAFLAALEPKPAGSVSDPRLLFLFFLFFWPQVEVPVDLANVYSRADLADV